MHGFCSSNFHWTIMLWKGSILIFGVLLGWGRAPFPVPIQSFFSQILLCNDCLTRWRNRYYFGLQTEKSRPRGLTNPLASCPAGRPTCGPRLAIHRGTARRIKQCYMWMSTMYDNDSACFRVRSETLSPSLFQSVPNVRQVIVLYWIPAHASGS